MSASGLALGRLFNVVRVADGVAVKLTDASAVTFITYEDDGSTIATMTELDSTGVESEQALDVDFEPYKAPGVGGTWTAMTEQDDTVDLGDDGTNDAMALTVHASQLSDGYDSVECTVDGGTVVAILHDLTVQRAPENLASPLAS